MARPLRACLHLPDLDFPICVIDHLPRGADWRESTAAQAPRTAGCGKVLSTRLRSGNSPRRSKVFANEQGACLAQLISNGRHSPCINVFRFGNQKIGAWPVTAPTAVDDSGQPACRPLRVTRCSPAGLACALGASGGAAGMLRRPQRSLELDPAGSDCRSRITLRRQSSAELETAPMPWAGGQTGRELGPEQPTHRQRKEPASTRSAGPIAS